MASDFLTSSANEFSAGWNALDSYGSERYRFFKARVHGKLHFVKTLSDTYKYDLLSIESLRKEFEIGYNLDHPNIARYLYFENDAIFEEYIDGKSLRELMDEKSPLLKEKGFIEKIVGQLLETIEYIHSGGVLHLDLKPENVMITRVGGNVKIIDFGCAYMATEDTTQGFTLQYKAPEQGNGETNAYTDIYLIGKIIEELVAHIGNSSKWHHFIAKTTAHDPADRFKTEQEAIAALPTIRRKKWLYTLTPILIIGGGLIALIFHQSEPIDIPKTAETSFVDSMYKDSLPPTINSAHPLEPEAAHLSATQTSIQTQEDITKRLEKEIISKIAADYLKTVKPVCNPDTIITDEALANVQKLLKQVQKRSFALGDSLSARYPDRAAWIQSKVHEVISSQQSQVAVWFYGP